MIVYLFGELTGKTKLSDCIDNRDSVVDDDGIVNVNCYKISEI